MTRRMSLPPLQKIPEGVVEEPHVEMAKLVLAFKYHKFANCLAFIGGHFLVAVLVSVVGKPTHLGSDFGIADFKV